MTQQSQSKLIFSAIQIGALAVQIVAITSLVVCMIVWQFRPRGPDSGIAESVVTLAHMPVIFLSTLVVMVTPRRPVSVFRMLLSIGIALILPALFFLVVVSMPS